MNAKLRSLLFNAIKIAVTIGMLAYVLLVRINWGDLLAVISGARWSFLLVAVLLAVGGVALRAVRWLALLSALDIDVSLGRLIGLYFVGTFFNIFLLSGLGGDAIRMMELARHSKRTPEAVGTVLVDRANGLWVLFLVGLLALPVAARDIPFGATISIAAVALAVLVGGWVVMGTRFVPWLGSKVRLPGQAKLERFYRAVSGCGYLALGQASAISLLFNVINIAVNYLIALGLNADLPFVVVAAFTPILSISLLLPSIGGLGVRETAYMLTYGTVDVSNTTATAMGLAQFGVQTLIPGLIGALLYAVEGAAGLRGQQSELQE